MNKTKHNGEGGIHYKLHGTQEVIEAMEEVATNIASSLLEANKNEETVPLPLHTIIRKAMNASYAQKHIKRAGTKDIASIDSELHKAENYLHRARTGRWL